MHAYIIQPHDMNLTHFFFLKKMHSRRRLHCMTVVEVPWISGASQVSFWAYHLTSAVGGNIAAAAEAQGFVWLGCYSRWLEKVCKLGFKRSWPVWAIRPKKENNIEEIDMNRIHTYIYICR